MNVFLNRQQAARRKDLVAQAGAALGVMSLPVANDSNAVKRLPITLEQIARHPKVWVAWLTDAGLRMRRGFRLPSQRRTGKGDDRREDKMGTTKLFRRISNGR